jgi:hypothetical protein
VADLRKSLNDLPETLAETYQRMMARISKSPKDHIKWARQILEWLIFARRPLTLAEVASLTMIDVDGNKPYDPDKRLRVEEEVLSICAGFITLRFNADYNSSRLYSWQFSMDYELPDYKKSMYHVVLAHLSVKEFLTSKSVRDPAFMINPELSQVLIACSCIAIVQKRWEGLYNYARCHELVARLLVPVMNS